MSLVSEDHLLVAISHYFPGHEAYPHLLNGRDDDCAFVCAPGTLCVSTDLFMEDVHFRRRYFCAEDIGWKALAVNLSDLAACGARPLGFSLGLALPTDADMDLVHGLLGGMSELAAQSSSPLTGGDLSRSDRLHLCITVFGQAEAPLRRAQAKAGDRLFLIGQLGLARTGLARLEAEGRKALRSYPESCAAHLRPIPLLEAGQRLHDLAKTKPESRIGLMDLSDGLSRDIPRLIGLAPSGSHTRPEHAPGADLVLPPISSEIARYCAANELDPNSLCLNGGEDYALIGSCAPEYFEAVCEAVPEAVELGTVTSGSGLRCGGHPVPPGFDHFA